MILVSKCDIVIGTTALEVCIEGIKAGQKSELVQSRACFAIQETESREKKKKSSNTKQRLLINTSSATLESSFMLPFTIRISNHHLTLHQHNSYQYNHATSSNITTPQPTSLSKQITLPPSRDIFLRFPHPSTSLSFCNSDSFRPPDTILWYPSIHHLQPEL